MTEDLRETIIELSLEKIKNLDDEVRPSTSHLIPEFSKIDRNAETILKLVELAIEETQQHTRVHQEQETFTFVYESFREFSEKHELEQFSSIDELFTGFKIHLKAKVQNNLKKACDEQGIERVSESFDQARQNLKRMGINQENLTSFDEILGKWFKN